MPRRAKRRLAGESGFTLLEILVVIILIGILAAIAIPSFISQKSKANDSSAKVVARTAETAAESYSTDHSGEYKGLTAAELQSIESTLQHPTGAELVKAEPSSEGTGYLVEAKSLETGDTFKIERTAGGEALRSCKQAGKGGCPPSGSW